MASSLTALELRLVEAVLEMDGGYVLDFSDRSFHDFFEDLGVDMGDPAYSEDGRSKGKRLRRFLRIAEAELVGRALEHLLEYRLATGHVAVPEDQVMAFRKIIERLGHSQTHEDGARPGLTRRSFDPALFQELPIDQELNAILCARMSEAERCLQVAAHLSTVILCGSVLEGLCLGFALQRAEELRDGYCRVYNKGKAQDLERWTLAQFIDVFSQLGHFSPNIGKFSTSLRDFRNFVHPEVELRNQFAPDHHTAHISFQVVLAAADDLTKATRKQKNVSHG